MIQVERLVIRRKSDCGSSGSRKENAVKANYRVFLSYVREDANKVRRLYDGLRSSGLDPWMDEAIRPGQDWAAVIRRAIRDAGSFVVCLSPRSLDKRGWVQREIKEALDIMQGMLATDVFVIPARLEPCEIPESLCQYQAVDMFTHDGLDRLITAIRSEINLRNAAQAPLGGGVASPTNHHSLPPSEFAHALNIRAIDVAVMRQGATEYLLYWRDGKVLKFEDNRWILSDIETAINPLSGERSPLDAFLCLRRDHLIDGYDSFSIRQLFDMVDKYARGTNLYVAVSKDIGPFLGKSAGKEDDSGALLFWFSQLLKGGTTDILEITMDRYGVDCLRPASLSNAANNSRKRKEAICDLVSDGSWRWKCIIPGDKHSALHRFLEGFLTYVPGNPALSHLLAVVTARAERSQTKFVEDVLKANAQSRCVVASYVVPPSLGLKKLCEKRGLTLVIVRGPFELRYLLHLLNGRK